MRKRVAYVFYFLVSAMGCIWQVHKISNEYFQYEVVSQLQIVRPRVTRPSSLMICFRLADIMKQPQNMSTVSSIFEMTPKPEAIVNGCTVREKLGYEIESYKSDRITCTHIFLVTKFIKQRYLCYSFVFRDHRTYMMRYLTNSLQSFRFYSIYLNRLFDQSNYIYFFVESNKTSFGLSDSFTEHYRTSVNATGHSNSNYVTVSYRRFESHLLKPPYKTECFDYRSKGLDSASECYDLCMSSKGLETLNKIPFEIAITQPLDVRMISGYDLKTNASHKTALKAIEAICEKSCQRIDCFIEDYSPKIVATSTSNELSFELYAPNQPEVVTTFLPIANIVDYITLALSCISFWFGWSPMYFLRKLKPLEKCTRHNRKWLKTRKLTRNFETACPPKLD